MKNNLKTNVNTIIQVGWDGTYGGVRFQLPLDSMT